MEQKQKIIDEQIGCFLSGTATEEERKAVLEYVSECDENLEDLMIVAESVYAQRKADAAANNTSATEIPTNHKDIRPLHRFNSVSWRVAASVALVLVAGGIVLTLSNRGVGLSSVDDPVLANNTNPQEVSFNDDADKIDNTINQPSRISSQSSDIFAEANPSSTDSISFWDKHRTSPTENTSTGTGKLMASSQRVKENPISSASAINPPDTEFDIKPEVPKQWSAGKDMVISWKCNMPQKVVLEMGLINGMWIYKKEFSAPQDSVVVTSNVLRNLTIETDTIKWRMKAYFDNGKKSSVKTGIIKIEE